VAERGGRGIADRQIIVDDSRLAAMFELGFSRRCNKAAGAASGVGVARGAGEGEGEGGGAGGSWNSRNYIAYKYTKLLYSHVKKS
jgi:hypothetical protein